MKTAVAAERDDGARARWRRQARAMAAHRLVFLDETGTTTAMTRRRARAPRGQRAYDTVPRNRGTVTTLIAALTASGMSAGMTIDGSTTAQVFCTYLERVLIPTLTPGQIVIADNVAAHKSSRARELIEAAGCRLEFLPAYSPDLNPIEEAFSKLKTHLRAVTARTHQALDAAIDQAMRSITATDAAGWFRHAGYQVNHQPT